MKKIELLFLSLFLKKLKILFLKIENIIFENLKILFLKN